MGVIANGTAVLGLGNIGPLAGKPVMEGKACLFKKFAGIDVFDIQLAERDPDKLVDIIAALEPTLGGVTLKDIKAPECLYIGQRLRARMQIPGFHNDQHGTGIISAAALINGLQGGGQAHRGGGSGVPRGGGRGDRLPGPDGAVGGAARAHLSGRQPGPDLETSCAFHSSAAAPRHFGSGARRGRAHAAQQAVVVLALEGVVNGLQRH